MQTLKQHANRSARLPFLWLPLGSSNHHVIPTWPWCEPILPLAYKPCLDVNSRRFSGKFTNQVNLLKQELKLKRGSLNLNSSFFGKTRKRLPEILMLPACTALIAGSLSSNVKMYGLATTTLSKKRLVNAIYFADSQVFSLSILFFFGESW
jgi:hypothetical protein